jgi:hypothetical protein
MKPQLFSGARGRIDFTDKDGNTQTLAFVTDVSIQSNHNLRPSYVIGDINPKTIEPLGEDASASIGRIIPMNESTSSAAKQKFTAIDWGLEEKVNDMLSAGTVEIVIYDKNPGDPTKPNIVGSLKYARAAGKSMSMSSSDLATERYQFIGIWEGSYGNDQVGQTVNYGVGDDQP